LPFSNAADVSLGVFDRAHEIARRVAVRSADFRATDPKRLPSETKPVETQGPAKQRGVAVFPNVGENPRGNAFGSRIMHAAPREEFRSHCIG
jgi:hypothetical protein